MTERARFTVITNENYVENNTQAEKEKTYHTSPIGYQKDFLREKFAKYVNREAGPKFTIEDFLRC